MTNITIFSTRTLKERNCLFDENVKPISDTKAQEIVYNYFLRLRELIYKVLNDEEKRNKLKDLFISKLESIQTDFPDYATSLDTEKAASKKQEITYAFLKRQINAEFTEPYDVDGMMARIETWGLGKKALEICIDHDIIEKTEEKSRLYEIANAYALHCLGNDDKDLSHKRWIPCLIRCAKVMSNGSPIDLILVLHDKDLGDTSEYAQKDITIIEKDEVIQKFDSETHFLTKEDDCRIIFFQHTTNTITEILREPFSEGRDIHDEVYKAFNYYKELNLIKANSMANLECEDGIAKAIEINKELNETMNKL